MRLPAKPFYMIRHGQTVANAQGTAAGALDTPLTETGRQQARAVAPLLCRLAPAPTMIVHSALSRARDTASLLNAEINLPIAAADARLNERSYGDWVGQPWDAVHARMSAGETPPNGESWTDFSARVMAGLQAALETCSVPLLVTHGGVFDVLAAHYGLAFEDAKNCALYLFQPLARCFGTGQTEESLGSLLHRQNAFPDLAGVADIELEIKAGL